MNTEGPILLLLVPLFMLLVTPNGLDIWCWGNRKFSKVVVIVLDEAARDVEYWHEGFSTQSMGSDLM